ncbi:MAG: serine O-acetyltransferase EpsC [Bacteroidota bacterium]|nr:serine O-acetyltransferase EpsC [Bacteroidota bacterium]
MLPKPFVELIFKKHISTEVYPATSSISRLITKIILILFPEQTKKHYQDISELFTAFEIIEKELSMILQSMQAHLPKDASVLSKEYMQMLPHIYHLLDTDIKSLLDGDPAAKNEYEIVRTYPGFYAVAFYRLAHGLYVLNIPLLPRVLTEFAHSKTGIDIHPGATIGENLYIDHGTGIVIGETCIIGKNVKIYQGVTLGALSVSKDLASKKRHPTIEDNVVIYSNATILGGETVIGHDSVVGGNVWLTRSIDPYTKIYHQEQVKISDK